MHQNYILFKQQQKPLDAPKDLTAERRALRHKLNLPERNTVFFAAVRPPTAVELQIQN